MNDTPQPLLRVLHVEDNPDDSALVRLALRRYYQVDLTRVETAEELSVALHEQEFDLVLCDYNLPTFSASDALSMIRRCDANTPCIVVSGTMTEDEAVTLMENGARDYLLKDSLHRLAPAIRREMLDAKIRRERIAAELAAAEAQVAAQEAERRAALVGELEHAYKELRETQSQLVQSAKMASLGQLVAGLAHEINNPLGFSLSHLQTVQKLVDELSQKLPASIPRDEVRKYEKLKDRVQSIQQGLERVGDLVQKLRVFSRRDEAEFKWADIKEGILSTLALLNHRVKNGVHIDHAFAEDNRVFCSPGAINQVVMNLLSNALDAVNGEGLIKITTQRDDAEFRICVSDDGPGIPDEVRDRVFEPFFTTKDVGAGTGLGLAITYKIVDRHGGGISIECPATGGTSFIVTLPLSTG